MTKYYLSSNGDIVIFTTDRTTTKPQNVYLLEYFDTEQELQAQINKDWLWGKQFISLKETESAQIDFMIIQKSKSHNLISSGAWAQELSVAMSFAREIGKSAEESLRDAIINFMAEETKFLKDAQWIVDNLITDAFKVIFNTIPVLQRKIMKETLRILSLGEPSSPLSALSDFLQKEYAND